MAKSRVLLLILLTLYFQNVSCQNQQWRNPVGGNVQPVDSKLSACYEPKVVGPCRARVPKYFYNVESKECELFFYGGCDQNKNNFETFEECSSTCTEKIRRQTKEATCTGPAQSGPFHCMGHMQRWSFNTTTSTCETLVYGGCGATLNNFVSELECQLNCVDSVNGCGFVKDPGSSCANNSTVTNWWFNKDTGECEEFVYNGCGGNSNRFESLRQCQEFCGGTKARQPQNSIGHNCEGVKCPRGGNTHYKELGCTPVYDDGACCPTRYDCPDRILTRNSSQCVYDGKVYNVGEAISAADSGSGCRAGCGCTIHGINCANVECPSNFGYYPKENCEIELYKPGQCCAHEFACGNETITCTFEGKDYVEGQKMYPKDEPCLKCYCKPGFNGTLSSEYCEEIDCGIQVWYSRELEKGCTPVYFQDAASRIGCCPISWHCPDDQEPKVKVNETQIGQEISQILEPGPVLTIPSDLNGQTNNGSSSTNSPQILDKIQVAIQNTTSTSPHILPIIIPENICNLPKTPGDCRAKRLRYYYNNETSQCEEFYYTGCKGNKNNFERLADCNDECGGQKDLQSRFRAITKPDRERQTDPCVQPVSPGRCRAYFPRFYYNALSGLCQFFIFGGCQRNDNNFYSKESCEATCATTYPNVCDKKPVDLTKDCGGGNFTKFYYDVDEGVCKRFVSTGCQSSNVFDRLSDCDSACRGNQGPTKWKSVVDKEADKVKGERDKICMLPKKVGSCYASVPSFYYDVANGSCLPFLYGGCFGNRNRFESLQSCRQTCETTSTTTLISSVVSKNSGAMAFNEHGSSLSGENNYLRGGSLPVPTNNVNNGKPQGTSLTTNSTAPNTIHDGPLNEESFIFARIGKPNQKPSTINNEFLQKPLHPDPSIPDNFYTPQVEDPSLIHPHHDDEDDEEESDFNHEDFIKNFTSLSEGDPWLNFTPNFDPKQQNDSLLSNFTHDFDNQQPWLNYSRQFNYQKLQSRPQTQPLRIPTVEPPPRDSRRDVCLEKLSTGNCSQTLLRFYWDGHSCRPFNYTGCSGNQNQFMTEHSCRQTCDDNFHDVSSNLYCQFGRRIIPFGHNLNDSEDKCDTEFCTCITPPSLTCTLKDCPHF